MSIRGTSTGGQSHGFTQSNSLGQSARNEKSTAERTGSKLAGGSSVSAFATIDRRYVDPSPRTLVRSVIEFVVFERIVTEMFLLSARSPPTILIVAGVSAATCVAVSGLTK